MDSKTNASSDATLTNHSSSAASAEKRIEHTNVPNTTAFGFSVSGVLAGSGSGSEVTWSATLQQKFFWLEPMEKIVTEGTAVSITANGDKTSSLDWTISDATSKNLRTTTGNSITLNKKFWEDNNITIPAGRTPPLTGQYDIAVKTVEVVPKSASTISKIHVVNITKPAKNGLTEKWDDTTKKYDSQVIKGNHLSIAGIWAGAAGGEWKVTQGTLANKNNASTTFLHSSAQKDITLRLFFTLTGSTSVDSRTIDVYQDRLALCRENFGDNRPCDSGWKPVEKYGLTTSQLPEQSIWNCFGSVLYMCNGTGSGYCSYTSLKPLLNDVPKWTVTRSQNGQISPAMGSASRGDIVVYSTVVFLEEIVQHAQIVLANNTVYAANNMPVGVSTPWCWKENRIGDYATGDILCDKTVTIRLFAQK